MRLPRYPLGSRVKYLSEHYTDDMIITVIAFDSTFGTYTLMADGNAAGLIHAVEAELECYYTDICETIDRLIDL